MCIQKHYSSIDNSKIQLMEKWQKTANSGSKEIEIETKMPDSCTKMPVSGTKINEHGSMWLKLHRKTI